MSESQPSEPTPSLSLEAMGEFEIDPEIEALLDFEPVPRKIAVKGGWTPELQRAFIVRVAHVGSTGLASEMLGMDRSGARKLYNSPHGASFRAAWDGAVALAARRKAEESPAEYVGPDTRPPSLDNRRKAPDPGPLPRAGEGEAGQVLNEFGEWENEDSLRRRGEEARDRISNKLLGARRLYLQSISGDRAKRAAFEILTELPVDWKKAKRLEPQPDEPWRQVNLRQPDMLMTAENGWLGELTRGGADRKAELIGMINAWRAEQGKAPVGWDDGQPDEPDGGAE